MVAIDVDRGILEDGVGVALGSDPEVLLAERLHLRVDVVMLLRQWLASSNPRRMPIQETHKLFRKRDLLELHLVDAAGLGEAKQPSCDQRSNRHGCRMRRLSVNGLGCSVKTAKTKQNKILWRPDGLYDLRLEMLFTGSGRVWAWGKEEEEEEEGWKQRQML